MNYLTCKAEYHSLSRQRITLVPTALVQYLALTTCDILPYRLDNIILQPLWILAVGGLFVTMATLRDREVPPLRAFT